MMVENMKKYHDEGAVFVGANTWFDIKKIKDAWERHNNLPFELSGLDLSRLRVADVCAHDRTIEPQLVPKGHPAYKPRTLTSLCGYYGVNPGGHRALADSHAAVEVFMKQIERNNAEAAAIAQARKPTLSSKRKFSSRTQMPSGAELSKLGPHDSKAPECGGCHHLDELEALHTEDGNERMLNIIKLYRQLHNPEGV